VAEVTFGATYDKPAAKLSDRCFWSEATFADASGAGGLAPRAVIVRGRPTVWCSVPETATPEHISSDKISLAMTRPVAGWVVQTPRADRTIRFPQVAPEVGEPRCH
jgi:hypothetical protein